MIIIGCQCDYNTNLIVPSPNPLGISIGGIVGITIGGIVFLVLVGVISCWACSCCCFYKPPPQPVTTVIYSPSPVNRVNGANDDLPKEIQLTTP